MSDSADATRVAVCNRENEVMIFDVDTKKVVQRLPQLSSHVTAMAFAPDGQRLAVSRPRFIDVYDLRGGERVLTLHGPERPLRGLTFDSIGHRMAGVADDDAVYVWDGTPVRETLPPPRLSK